MIAVGIGIPHSHSHMRRNTIERWLGVVHRVQQAMVFYAMNDHGHVVAHSTVMPLEPSNYDADENKIHMTDLDATINNQIGNYRNAVNQHVRDIPDLSDDQ